MSRAVALCPADELTSGTARRFDVEGVRLAVARIDDDFFALGDECSHEDFSLALGDVDVDTCEIECARHGAAFDLRTGAPLSLPATKPVATYAVSVVDGVLTVELPA